LSTESYRRFSPTTVAGTTNLLSGGAYTTANGSTTNFSGTFNNQGTLTNSGTFQGAGTISGSNLVNNTNAVINANAVTTLTLNGGTNAGTLEATGTGGLDLYQAYTNTSGTIEALTNSGVVLESGATINGGTLATVGSGTLSSNGSVALNSVNLSGTYTTGLGIMRSIHGELPRKSVARLRLIGQFAMKPLD